MEKRKIILTVLGVAVLLVISIFVFNKRSTPPITSQPIVNEPAPAVFKNMVTYKNGVFTPSNFSVKSGATVSFVNESDEGMWLASNPHPTHTSLPQFNTTRAYNKGEIYKFTFTKKGSFGYHNHLNPMARGTFTVN